MIPISRYRDRQSPLSSGPNSNHDSPQKEPLRGVTEVTEAVGRNEGMTSR
jgi:hypothetical protein